MIINSKNIKSYNNEAQTKFVIYFEDSKLKDLNLDLDSELLSKVKFTLDSEDFKCKNGELKNINLFRNESPKNIILIGIGKKEEFNLDKLRKNIAKAIKKSANTKYKSIDINIDNLTSLMNLDEITRTISEAAIMADYKFDKYKSDQKLQP